MENLMQVLDRAKARHEEHERAINASATLRDEFALYRLTPPGPGKAALFRSLRLSSPDFRGWFSTGLAIEEIARLF
jgi:hypothetical protein